MHTATTNDAIKNLSVTALTVYRSLVQYADGCTEEAAGGHWQSVCLDNAVPAGMTYHAFAGYLSALEAKGLYQPQDGYFGDVFTNSEV